MPAALATLLALVAADAAGSILAGPGSGQPAASGSAPAFVSWTAPAGCPTEEQFRIEIGRMIGTARAEAESAEARATVRRAGDGGWELTLETRVGQQTGERELAAPDCEALMRAAALVVALMMNPSAAMPPPPPPPMPPPPPEPGPGREFEAGVDLLLASGLQPGAPSPGLGVRAGWGGRISGEIRAGLWAQRKGVSPADASTGGDFDLATFAALACARARRGRRLVPGLCAGIELMRAHATGFGVSDPGAATGWWEAALLEASICFRISTHHALRVGLAGVVPLGRPTFALAGIGAVYEPSAVAAQAAVGWEVHF